jgi:hypothetical protein
MLIVKIEEAKINLMLWKWSERDFKIPLRVLLPDSTALVFLDDPDRPFSVHATSPRRPRQWVMHSTILFQFEEPTDDFRHGLQRPRTEKGERAAKKIHGDYLRCVDIVVTYCRLELEVHSILDGHKSDLFDLFGGNFQRQTKVSWSSNGEIFAPFNYKPKMGRKFNAIYRSEALIKPADWVRLERAISRQQMPPAEVRELLKLRSKVQWNEKRVSIVESAAIIEMALKNVVSNALLQRGVSKARLDSLRGEAGFSIFLNFMLPLGLSNTTYKRVLPLIRKIDKLRKLRNQIMHENLPEQHIDTAEAYEGVDSCVDLIMYLIKIGKWVPSR